MVTSSVDFKKIFSSVPDLYLVLDTKFNIVAVSDAYVKATLVTREKILGSHLFDVFPDNPNDPLANGMNNLKDSLNRVLENKVSDTMAIQKYDIKKRGEENIFEERYWSPINIPIFTDKNELQYILHRVEDVTEFLCMKKIGAEKSKLAEELQSRTGQMALEIYQRAEEIQNANKKLRITNEELNKKKTEQEYLYQKLENLINLKTQFFSNISHELRTPLTLILGPVEKILSEHVLSPDIYQLLTIVRKNIHILLKHVNDLLDVAKQDAGKLTLYYEKTDLSKLFRCTVDNFDSLAKERLINYVISLPPEPVIAEVDVNKIERILLNLLANAFKFTPPKGTVRVSLEKHDLCFKISVSDTGIGLSKAKKDQIFDRFYQSENSNRYADGTGLGLSIAKDFVELHHGNITVNNNEPKGATFSFVIPLQANVALHHSPDTTNHFQNISIDYHAIASYDAHQGEENDIINFDKPTLLVVEDNLDMLDFIKSMLKADFNILTARDGRIGLKKALHHKPDLILTDIMMPNLDGEQLVKYIRRDSSLCDIPIILLSAKADDELRIQLLREGAQDYLRKPFSEEELRARINNLVNLKLARDEVNDKVEKLTTANEELDAFSRTVSHDLKNPLTVINGFSSIILNQFNLDPLLADYVGEINKASFKMYSLIDDLLALSYASKHDLKLQLVNINQMVKEIVDEIKCRLLDRRVCIEIKANGYVVADEHLLKIALENLLNNAFKYTAKNDKAKIEFSLLPDQKFHVFAIRDNGVGFPENKKNQLFIPFSRLHADTAYKGTGIGLATVKRIIERHQGKVWAESENTKGACFYISLPKVSNQESLK